MWAKAAVGMHHTRQPVGRREDVPVTTPNRSLVQYRPATSLAELHAELQWQ